MFQPHPSRRLNELFARKPYQGAEPSTARFLFVGLDANYSPDLEDSPVFESVLEYHEDGIAFWRRTGVHHPFLLPQYRGDGRRYHRTFARIGFGPQHAELVSFIELLHVPTVGRNKLLPHDLDANHLKLVSEAIFCGRAEHIFVSSGVLRLMQASKAFPCLGAAQAPSGPLRVLHTSSDRTVYMHLHFSNYGKFEQQLVAEAKAIGSLLPEGDA
jgi:hypothetical protein